MYSVLKSGSNHLSQRALLLHASPLLPVPSRLSIEMIFTSKISTRVDGNDDNKIQRISFCQSNYIELLDVEQVLFQGNLTRLGYNGSKLDGFGCTLFANRFIIESESCSTCIFLKQIYY